MPIRGRGCFVGWYDLAPGKEHDHDHWHTHEHMIERVAIAGFKRGRRYRTLGGPPRVCIMYEVETLATLTSPAYLERLNAPTPWTSRSLPNFVNMNRTLSNVVASQGQGIGGFLLTIQLGPEPGQTQHLQSWLVDDALPGLAARPGLNAAHLIIGDAAASNTGTEEKKLRGKPDAVADWVLLVEGYDRAAVEEVAAELAQLGGLESRGGHIQSVGQYSLDYVIDEIDAKAVWVKPAT